MNSREIQHAPGVKRWSITNEMAAKPTASEHAREQVLLYLLRKGSATVGTIADDIAARCGTNEHARRAVTFLSKHGMLRQTGATLSPWELSDAGRAEAVRLQAAKAARRAA